MEGEIYKKVIKKKMPIESPKIAKMHSKSEIDRKLQWKRKLQ